MHLGGHLTTTLTRFWPFLTIYWSIVDIFEEILSLFKIKSTLPLKFSLFSLINIIFGWPSDRRIVCIDTKIFGFDIVNRIWFYSILFILSARYMDWSLNLATIIECFPFKWLWRPLVEPLVTLNNAEQCRHLACESIRFSKKWDHTFDLDFSEMSSNSFVSPSPYPPEFTNRKYFLGPKSRFEIF